MEKPRQFEKAGQYLSAVTWCLFVAILLISFGTWEGSVRYADANNTIIVLLAGVPLYVTAFICFLVLILFACRFRYYVLVILPALLWILCNWLMIKLLH